MSVRYYNTKIQKLNERAIHCAGVIDKEGEEFKAKEATLTKKDNQGSGEERKRRFWVNLIAIPARDFLLQGLNIAAGKCYPTAYCCFQRCC